MNKVYVIEEWIPDNVEDNPAYLGLKPMFFKSKDDAFTYLYRATNADELAPDSTIIELPLAEERHDH